MIEAGKKRIALLSNITADLLAAKLKKDYEVYLPEGYDTWIREVLDSTSGLYQEPVDAVFLLLDGSEARSWRNAEEAAERIFTWRDAAKHLVGQVTEAPVFLSTFVLKENRIRSLAEGGYASALQNQWYQFIAESAQTHRNVFFLDLAERICDIGRDNFYSNKMWYMSNMPYSREGLAAVAEEIQQALDAAFSPRKKGIVLDLDNTLWGGVAGEDGLEGIVLADHKEGQRYFDFQRQLLEMKRRGVVLAINSKNNEADVKRIFESHPAMQLKEEDFVATRINWDNKASNVKSIAEELNITEQGLVFVDDNPLERDIVRGECPEVTVPDFPEDTAELIRFGEKIWASLCRPLHTTEEDLYKTQMYQAEAERKKVEVTSISLDDYIAKLEMHVDIHPMRPEEQNRVAQLCGKTNQFNLTTKRYTKSDIADMAESDDHQIFVAYVRDKYGDSGLVAVLILADEEKDTRIDTFLMSCRVMGRKLEEVIVGEIADRLTSKGKLLADYIPTEKNSPVKDLYERLGFSLITEEEGHKRYELLLAGYKKMETPGFKEIQVCE